ncbi:MAG TPA: hypothetical protein PKA58_25480 [Polyangium sp.]|nr:hypothetical protein [Polyangium sp.]
MKRHRIGLAAIILALVGPGCVAKHGPHTAFTILRPPPPPPPPPPPAPAPEGNK